MLSDLVQHFLHWVEELGYWGIMIGLMIEIIPSEIVLSFGGYLVAQDKINFAAAVVFGVVGGTIAQIFIYWIGKYGGRPFLEKYGRYILINKHHIDVAEKWFNKYGTGVIFTARFIPVVRHAISIPAGMARMPLWKFTLYTTLAIIPWSILFIYLGYSLGDNWENIDEKAAPYVQPLLWAALGLTAVYAAYKYLESRRRAKVASEVPGERSEEDTDRRVETDGANNGKPERTSGDRTIVRLLESLSEDYGVFHHLCMGERNQQRIDHLVIGPNGIFHIDVQTLSKDVGKDPAVDPSAGIERPNPTAPLYRHEFALKELLRKLQIEADVVGVICLTDPNISMQGKSSSFAAVPPDRLVSFIQGYRPKKGRQSPEQVRRIQHLLEEYEA